MAINQNTIDAFQLYSFGRKIPNPPVLEPSRIESIGITLADKVPGEFRIEVDSIRSYKSGSGTARTPTENSLGTIAKSANINTLLKLVSLSEIELPVDEKVTIFAPSDEAFSRLPTETLELLVSPEGKETLRSIFRYHIVSGSLQSKDLLNTRSLLALNGQSIEIDLDQGFAISGSGINVVDIPFDGGLVHVIDTVLIPESKSILELFSQSKELSTLFAALSAAGIGDQLGNENGPWTVFAPTNSAFSKLPSGVVKELLQPQNRVRLIDMLGLHVVPGRISGNELLTNQRARTYFGNNIEFSIANGQITVQDARVITSDIQASNGVIHLINSVITPKEKAIPGNPNTSKPNLNSEAVRVCELAVRRGVTLYNDGQHEACSMVYEIAIESMIALGSDRLDPRGVERLMMGLSEAESNNDWSERAWIYRRALDDAFERFRSQDR